LPVKLGGTLLTAWAASLIVSTYLRSTPVMPWRFLLALILFALPIAHAIGMVSSAFERASRPSLLPILSIAAGLVLVVLVNIESRPVIIVALVLLVSFVWQNIKSGVDDKLGTLVLAATVLAVGFAAVRNLNYVAALLTTSRLHDATLRDIDLAIYGWLHGHAVEYFELFPLIRSQFVFHIFENAYTALFVELIALVLAFTQTRQHLMTIMGSVFLCYFTGILIFLGYPAVGPCIVYPESFASAYRATITGTVMDKLAAEYRAAVEGATVNGFGYFIAVPSLHVAIAVLCQLLFVGRRALFWLFIPVNVVLVSSTVLLGYHYLVDVPAGMVLGAAVYFFWVRPRLREPVSREGHIAPNEIVPA
jgi:membrane-associated phospholipid phosphatase